AGMRVPELDINEVAVAGGHPVGVPPDRELFVPVAVRVVLTPTLRAWQVRVKPPRRVQLARPPALGLEIDLEGRPAGVEDRGLVGFHVCDVRGIPPGPIGASVKVISVRAIHAAVQLVPSPIGQGIGTLVARPAEIEPGMNLIPRDPSTREWCRVEDSRL